MSVRSAVLLVSVAIAGSSTGVSAQSAAKILDRYVDAIGGKKAIEKIAATDVTGSISSADGRSGAFVLRTRRPDSLYVSLSLGEARWRAGFNGRAAWQDESVAGVQTLYGSAASRVRAEALYANTKFGDLDRIVQLSVAGPEQVRGRPVIVVVTHTSDGTSRRLFFDTSSHLLVKDEQETDTGVEERFYDDYRRVDGVLEPHRIEWHRNGESLQIAVDRITHGAVDGQVFDVPAAPPQPAIDVGAVLAAAGRNEARTDERRDPYAYTQTQSTRSIDDRGRITEREGRTHEVFHVGGRLIARMTRDRGQPLSEAERRREDERVNAIVKEYERQRVAGDTARAVPAPRAPAGRVLVWGPLGGPIFAAYLRLADFSHARRERLGGRPVIVLEFQPKPRAAPVGDVERQASKLAGTLWIDEASAHVVRIDASFRDDENGNVEGSSLRLERTLLDGSVWMPSRVETNLRRSWAFGSLSTMIGLVQYTDYKKFTVDTDATIELPDAAR